MHLTVSQRSEGSIPSLGTTMMMVMEEQKKGEEYIPYEEKSQQYTWTWLSRPRQFVCFLFFVTLFSLYYHHSVFLFRKRPVKIVLQGSSFENVQLLHRLHPNTMKLSKLVELNILSITVSLEKFQNASILPRRPVQKQRSQQN